MKHDSRFFAFGCSFTRYAWPTWADLIGVNFKEYYNYGLQASGNSFIQGRVYEADSFLKFNETDTVIVSLTSAYRLDMFNNGWWKSGGNIFSNVYYDMDFVRKYWSEEQGIYQSWLAAMSIRELLNAKKVKYKIISAFDQYPIAMNLEHNDLSMQSVNINVNCDLMAKEINNFLTVKKSINSWVTDNYTKRERPLIDFGVDKPSNKLYRDPHPTTPVYLEFIREFLPEYYTDTALRFVDEYSTIVPESNWIQHVSSAYDPMLKAIRNDIKYYI